MSFRSGWESFTEAVPSAYQKAIVKVSMLFFSGDLAELASDSYLSRGSLPEPFDIAAHIGNTREAAMATVGAFAMIGVCRLVERPREAVLKSARRVALGAFAVSSAVQLAGEHFELTNQAIGHNSGDVIDAAYGIGWSGLVAVGSLKLFRSVEQMLHDRAEARNAESEAWQQEFNETNREELE